jgi:ubiquitin-protein ligase
MSRIRLLRLESDEIELKDWLDRRGSAWVRILEATGRPPSQWRLELRVPGVERLMPLGGGGEGRWRAGPFQLRGRHEVLLEMPGDYPFRPPFVRFIDPLFHPNVFPSGRLCWGIAENDSSWWRGGDPLGTLVERLLHLVVGDPQCTNPRSPANREAVEPYLRHADLFPLQVFQAPAGPGPRPLRFRESVT